MKNLKIGKKLFVTFGVIIALFLLTVVIALASLNTTGGNFEEFYTVGYPVSNKTTDMRRATQNGLKSMSQSLLTEDLKKAQELIDEANKQLDSVTESFTFLEDNFRGDKSLLTKAQGILDQTRPYWDEMLAMAAENRNQEAADILFESFQPLMMDFQQVMTEIDNETTQLAAEEFEASDRVQSVTMVLLIAISVGALVATILLAVYITNGIKAPLTEIENAATRMAAGDLDVTVTYQSKDELGTLSDKIRVLTTTLKDIISDEDYLLGEMANGNFNITSRATDRYIGDFLSILTSIRGINSSLSDTLSQINQASDQVASGSDQVAGGAQELSQGATEQASSVEELAATINQISGQVQSNAQNAHEASEVADQVGAKMTESNEKMQEMIRAMGQISDSSSEIGKIIKTIEDIAFQTNILALNAAVEAARAGAAGKGFAVVADEVRNLANKSQEASKNTSTLIEGSIHAVENGTRIADETAQALMGAVEGAKSVTSLVGRISAASEEQAASIAQVTQGVDQISSVVQTNSATAEESAAASEELSGQAQMLKDLVGRFRLRESGGAASAPRQEYRELVPTLDAGDSKY